MNFPNIINDVIDLILGQTVVCLILEKHGYTVLRLPAYHCELHPIKPMRGIFNYIYTIIYQHDWAKPITIVVNCFGGM